MQQNGIMNYIQETGTGEYRHLKVEPPKHRLSRNELLTMCDDSWLQCNLYIKVTLGLSKRDPNVEVTFLSTA